MKHALLFAAAVLFWQNSFSQSYNTLWIPDTLAGPVFNLELKDSTRQFFNGTNTATGGINGDFWGPTLIFNQGDTVRMHVHNMLMDTTTLHWHGMHLPAIMDGGPHQPVAPGETWSPYWKVMNKAANYWYHPHMHMMAEEQITKGLGGLIIVRDSIERALNLPRTYGVDDIPLVLTDRKFNNSKQLVVAPYGDSMMVNGTLHPQCSLPAQVVRLRVLNASTERSYNIGFSDNRSFSLITTDGGLLNAPVSVTRLLLSAGERAEILVNFSADQGQSLDMKVYNSTLTQQMPGGDVFANGPFANALARKDFNMLHINVTAANANAVTTIPSTLTSNTFWNEASANLTRHLTISDSLIGGGGPTFMINHRLFDMDHIDYNVALNNTEIWEIASTSNFSHPFHIHDVEFYILTRNGTAPPAYEQGWKDVVLVKNQETVRFIAKFEDYADADSMHPFMFHCHIALHEDDGMMGQFIVTDNASSILAPQNTTRLKLFPNPTNGALYFSMEDMQQPMDVEVINTDEQKVNASWNNTTHCIDILKQPAGIYLVHCIGKDGQSWSGRIIKQ
jgi:FtsP/CotA-like multicopper oxidase with cupredoxin domain